jgi:hypothetical protein
MRRSSITELTFHGIYTSRVKSAGKCNPCVRYEMEPMSRAPHLCFRVGKKRQGQRSGECLLVKVKLACGSTEAKGRLCEGFQTPAVTNIPHGQPPASENLHRTIADLPCQLRWSERAFRFLARQI